MLACAELVGPVRFDGWDADGDPVGIPITSPEILCVATEEGQAGNTYDNILFMLTRGLVADAYPDLDAGITRTYLADGGSIEPITAVAQSKDGGKSTFVVADETHLWIDPRLKRLHDVLTRNITKRRIANGWLLETSTMYAPGEGSVAEETHHTAQMNPAVLFDHKEAPLDVDIADDDALRLALIDLYGPAAEWTNVDGIILDEFRNPMKRESDSRRYWLNQPWTTEEKFITAAAWDACEDSEREIPDGAPIVVGFDGSFNSDSTAAVGVLVAEVPHVFVIGHWQPSEPGEEVDILDVEAALLEAGRRYNVIECAADPYRWARSLQVLFSENLAVCNFPQSAARMSPATARFSAAVATGALTHSGDERLTTHVLNAVVVSDSRGTRVQKDSKKSPRKIDLAVAALMALDRCAQSEDADRELQRQRRRHANAI
jgi:phage terminase large subunit-like protein